MDASQNVAASLSVLVFISDEKKTIFGIIFSFWAAVAAKLVEHRISIGRAENTKGGSITVPLTSCLTGLD
jgi:hypothetical protein